MRTPLTVNRLPWLVSILMVLSVLVACVSEPGQPELVTPDSGVSSIPQRAPAPVEAIDIFQDGTFPVQVRVVAQGRLPNECTSVDQIRQERRGGTFFIAIDSVQYSGESCTDTPIAFEESIALDLIGLPAGIYVVDVNGLQGTFKLQRDNIEDASNAVLGGLVWHDSCEQPIVAAGEDVSTPAGCVDLGQGRFRGDGVRAADESGISGVMVQLGAGICPSIGLATTLTASDGTFLFSGLQAGDYCLTVAGNGRAGGVRASEGEWTYPEGALGQLTVSIQPGETNLDSAFGWTPSQPVSTAAEPVFFATPASECSNKALFVADVTVPDYTLYSPGETFTKTWRLQNLGSCTWDSSYSLVFAGGEGMGAPDSVPITITVPPGEFGELSIGLVAPESPGEFRGEWKLASADGARFGIGPGSDRPFWVQIIVVEEELSD